jgi:peptidoglycan hydrolase-like protein with peptidoglycan-binding domain
MTQQTGFEMDISPDEEKRLLQDWFDSVHFDPDPAGGPMPDVADPEDETKELQHKYDVSPVGTPGGRQNWVDKVGGLPLFIRAIAHALIRNGHTESRAIEMAVGICYRWARGGGNVTAKTRAKAAAAIAEWLRKRGQSRVIGAVRDATSVARRAMPSDSSSSGKAFEPGMHPRGSRGKFDRAMRISHNGRSGMTGGEFRRNMQQHRRRLNMLMDPEKYMMSMDSKELGIEDLSVLDAPESEFAAMSVGLAKKAWAFDSAVLALKATQAAENPGLTWQKVQGAQELLVELGFEVPVNGLFGRQTKESIAQVQKEASMPVTGAVDDDTLLVMEAAVKQLRGDLARPGL